MRARLLTNPVTEISLISLFAFLLSLSLALFSSSIALANSTGDQLESDLATMLLMQDLGLTNHPQAAETHREIVSDGANDTVEVSLYANIVGDIHLLIKGPHGFLTSNQRYITLLIASGIYTGKESIGLLSQLPGVVLVGIDYPNSIQSILTDPQNAFQFLRRTPGNIALSLEWLSRQSWVEGRGPSAMGVSLGGLFLPVALRMAQKLGVVIPRNVFAFTGSDLITIASNNLKNSVADNIKGPLLQLVSGLTLLNDPRLHLPFVPGDHLVVRADNDQTIPASSTDQLFDLLQGSKQSVVLHGGHIGSDTPDLISATESAILAWIDQGF